MGMTSLRLPDWLWGNPSMSGFASVVFLQSRPKKGSVVRNGAMGVGQPPATHAGPPIRDESPGSISTVPQATPSRVLFKGKTKGTS